MDTPPDRPEAGPRPAAAVSPPEPRQRWRLTFSRDVAAGSDGATGRDYIALWEEALAASSLPVARTDAGRFRFALAAPLPAHTAGRAELADLWLTERLPAWRVRQALDGAMPAGHDLVALEDVWLGAPALAGRVAAADYAVTLAAGPGPTLVGDACDRLLAAERLIRERTKGGGVKTYDLRPLVMSVSVRADGVLAIRTRIHPELGSGRPDEVVAAVADHLGMPLEAVDTVRERLVLTDDLATEDSHSSHV